MHKQHQNQSNLKSSTITTPDEKRGQTNNREQLENRPDGASNDPTLTITTRCKKWEMNKTHN